jgi:hypothetical protein
MLIASKALHDAARSQAGDSGGVKAEFTENCVSMLTLVWGRV